MSKKNAKIDILSANNYQNQKFVDEFIKLINLIKLENTITTDKKTIQVNTFRIANLKKNLLAMSKFKVTINNVAQLVGLPGFGKGTLSRINEILIKGYLSEVKELEKLYSKMEQKNTIIEELSEVIGIGKVIATELIDKHGITSLEDLITRVKTKSINVNDKISLGLKYAGKFETKIPRKIVGKIYDLINEIGLKKNPNLIINICGSYRRGLPQSSDLDILICDFNLLFKQDIEKFDILKKFITSLKKKKIITDDITSDSVSSKYMGFCKYQNKNYRIDIRLVPLESYYTALIYFTGSYQLNTIMRSKAKKLGYKLNEYGLYKLKSDIPIVLNSEKDLFDILKIEYLEPQQRNIL
jgi:DNA polymerase/3'-5' exonuclease PolX